MIKLNTQKQQIKLMKVIHLVDRIGVDISKKPKVSKMLRTDAYHYTCYRASLLEAKRALEKAVVSLQKCEKINTSKKQKDDQLTLFEHKEKTL